MRGGRGGVVGGEAWQRAEEDVVVGEVSTVAPDQCVLDPGG